MGNTLIACRSNEPIEAPGRIKLAPWGLFESSTPSGTRIKTLVDEEAFALMNAEFIRHGVDVPIDYEHQTLGGQYASETGAAPAAGWIKRLHAVPGSGLFADVEWTPKGAARIESKEYRYPSIVGTCRNSDHRVIRLHSVALTNVPAIAGIDPIVNSLSRQVVNAETQRIVNQAGAEWDANEFVQKFCSRDAYVNGVVREESMVASSDRASPRGGTRENKSAARRAGAEWDANQCVQRMCSRDAFINQSVQEAEALSFA